MPKYATQIPPEVARILKAAKISGNTLSLASEPKLNAQQYAAVKKVIEAAGGKWNRSAQTHIFAKGNPAEIFAEALAAGSITDTKRLMQQFFTPPEVAQRVVAMAGVKAGWQVLEPSAGHGALADALLALTGRSKIQCVDIDPECVGVLRQNGFSFPITRDFLSIAPPESAAGQFDAVVMNPPFTAGADIAHVQHAFRFVKPDGRVTAIMGKGWRFNAGRKYEEFRGFFAAYSSASITELPEGTFKESGTNVGTLVIQITKPKL